MHKGFMKKIDLIIPVFNEENNIEYVFQEIIETKIDKFLNI